MHGLPSAYNNEADNPRKCDLLPLCQHNGWDIDPNGGAVAGIPFKRQGTGSGAGRSDSSGRKDRNESVSPRGDTAHVCSGHTSQPVSAFQSNSKCSQPDEAETRPGIKMLSYAHLPVSH